MHGVSGLTTSLQSLDEKKFCGHVGGAETGPGAALLAYVTEAIPFRAWT
jgi:hypothetical protein